jgi:hypothetical protein
MQVGGYEWLYNPVTEQFETVHGDWTLSVTPVETNDLGSTILWEPAIKHKLADIGLVVDIQQHKDFNDAAKAVIKIWEGLK